MAKLKASRTELLGGFVVNNIVSSVDSIVVSSNEEIEYCTYGYL